MQISISTRHGHLSQETQERITGKVQRLSRYYDRLTGIEVTVDLEHRDEAGVEVRVTAERADAFVASQTDSSVMAALDVVVDRLEQQLRKHKEKKTDHHRSERRHEAMQLLDDGDGAEQD